MTTTRVLFCGGSNRQDGEADGFDRLASRLTQLDLARLGPGRPRLLVGGPVQGPAPPDFSRVRSYAARIRKVAARRARTGELKRIILLPELTACPELVGAARTGLEAFQPALTVILPDRDPRRLARQIREADLAIGLAGPECLEYCAFGLGQVLIPLDARQNPLAAELDRTGAAMRIAAGDDIAIAIERAIADLLEVKAMFRLMREAALDLCEGVDTETMAQALTGLLAPAAAERLTAHARNSA